MNGKPNPTENFLISTLATLLNGTLRPALYVTRSHMGIQHTALIPVLWSAVLMAAGMSFLDWMDPMNRNVIILYAVLLIVGYLRNTFQARRRRKQRDWSVSTWSTGESLLEPVLIFSCSRIRRHWGHKPAVRRMIETALTGDFIYYVGEPSLFVVAAAALWSIGSSMCLYPIVLALICIIVRNDAQLWLYLKAAEIPDGKRLERAVKTELEGPETFGHSEIPVAEIPPVPRMRFATDDRSVFDRLSPELQTLLMKDRILHGRNKGAR
jgi:hypothetical protein